MMRHWAGTPTEEEKLTVKAAGAKYGGAKQPLIGRWLESVTDAWHVVVPVVDDVTDVMLLASTADTTSPLWWICLTALVEADIERLWLLCTLCLTTILLPFLWCRDLIFLHGWGTVDDFLLGGTDPRLFALLNCRGGAEENTFRDRLKDSFLWVLVGLRSRCSPLWRVVGRAWMQRLKKQIMLA